MSSLLLIHNPLCPALNVALLIYVDLIPGMCCATAGSAQPEPGSRVPANYFSRSSRLFIPCMQWLALPNIQHLLSISHPGAFVSPIRMVLSQNFEWFVFSLFAHVRCCYLSRQEKIFLLRYRSGLPTTNPVSSTFCWNYFCSIAFLSLFTFWNCIPDYCLLGCIIADGCLILHRQCHE